ncbi:MAG TPA: hypothetical protein VMZ06_13140 [Candidatus Bathyarchaeia archaeon]|nr:hypothetical protein [Candidatus Bathyarchaeia archaeon]
MRTRTTEMHGGAWAHQRSHARVRFVKVMLRIRSVYLPSAS